MVRGVGSYNCTDINGYEIYPLKRGLANAFIYSIFIVIKITLYMYINALALYA